MASHLSLGIDELLVLKRSWWVICEFQVLHNRHPFLGIVVCGYDEHKGV